MGRSLLLTMGLIPAVPLDETEGQIETVGDIHEHSSTIYMFE
ncbi:hypothetical protein [Streptomyces sp. NPDC017435]